MSTPGHNLATSLYYAEKLWEQPSIIVTKHLEYI